jgi:type IV secretion system protein VirB4
LALCGASDPETQNLIDSLLRREGPDDFLVGFLEARGLRWVAELIPDFRASASDTEGQQSGHPINPRQKEMFS